MSLTYEIHVELVDGLKTGLDWPNSKNRINFFAQRQYEALTQTALDTSLSISYSGSQKGGKRSV